MDLQTLANLAEILGAVGIVFALVFGIVEIRQFNRQRQDAAAIELVRSFENDNFTRAYLLLTSLPTTVSAADFVAKGEAYEQAAITAGMKFETVGLLVYRGVIPLDDLDELVRGAAKTLWTRIRPWVEWRREAASHATFMEWFQWLIDRIDERRATDKVPAFERHV